MLEPVGEPVRRAAVAGDETSEFLLGDNKGRGIPDPAQFAADALADRRRGGVVDGILCEMKLAALPRRAREDGAASGFQPGAFSPA